MRLGGSLLRRRSPARVSTPREAARRWRLVACLPHGTSPELVPGCRPDPGPGGVPRPPGRRPGRCPGALQAASAQLPSLRSVQPVPREAAFRLHPRSRRRAGFQRGAPLRGNPNPRSEDHAPPTRHPVRPQQPSDQRPGAARQGRVRQCGVELGVASGLHFQAALGVICSGCASSIIGVARAAMPSICM